MIDLLIDREIIFVTNGLISSIFYAEINRLINPKNKRITTFLYDFIPDGGNSEAVH